MQRSINHWNTKGFSIGHHSAVRPSLSGVAILHPRPRFSSIRICWGSVIWPVDGFWFGIFIFGFLSHLELARYLSCGHEAIVPDGLDCRHAKWLSLWVSEAGSLLGVVGQEGEHHLITSQGHATAPSNSSLLFHLFLDSPLTWRPLLVIREVLEVLLGVLWSQMLRIVTVVRGAPIWSAPAPTTLLSAQPS